MKQAVSFDTIEKYQKQYPDGKIYYDTLDGQSVIRVESKGTPPTNAILIELYPGDEWTAWFNE